MDFFEYQDASRRSTTRLVALFALAVAAIAATTYLVVVLIIAGMRTYASRPSDEARFHRTHEVYSTRPPATQAPAPPLAEMLWQPSLLLGVGGAVVVVIVGASLWKMMELRGGGRALAESLGGQLISPDTSDPARRRVLNVVEEMAIASGTPAPAVYLLEEEPGINAFAAGYTPGDAVVGVTRGTVEKLSRDELQGVIGHEFSHILNGDMRLNLRLIGVIYGIVALGLVGHMLLRSLWYVRAGRSRGRGKGGAGGVVIAILLIGVALIVIGAVGTLIARIIKASVARQRELLADASSTQFTRNPAGLAGALKKIGGSAMGSRLGAPAAEQASHMYFSEGVGNWLGSLLATHPPLPERIRRLEPQWDGKFIAPTATAQITPGKAAAKVRPQVYPAAPPLPAGAALAELGALRLVDRVGRPTPEHVDYAAKLLAGLPEPLRQAAHEPYGARAVVYALLLDEKPEVRAVQMDQLARQVEPDVRRQVTALAATAAGIDPRARLPLIDMALPALRALTLVQYRAFAAAVDALMRADKRIDVFEWVLRRVLLHHLAPRFSKRGPRKASLYSLRPLAGACSCLLSTLAHVGAAPEAAQRAFVAGARHLPMPVEPIPREACRLDLLDEALAELDAVSPREKRLLLQACAVTVAADRRITVREAELLRGIADALGCPVPPLLPGQAM